MLIEFFKFSDNCDVLGTEFISILNDAWEIIMVVVPIILVVMIILDMIKAITAGDDKEVKEAQKKAITRIIIGVCIYFLPMIVKSPNFCPIKSNFNLHPQLHFILFFIHSFNLLDSL